MVEIIVGVHSSLRDELNRFTRVPWVETHG
jgi:hypothetical protein